jgi:hypothetical protein
MPSSGRSAKFLWKQALEFRVNAVGHGLDPTQLLYGGSCTSIPSDGTVASRCLRPSIPLT